MNRKSGLIIATTFLLSFGAGLAIAQQAGGKNQIVELVWGRATSTLAQAQQSNVDAELRRVVDEARSANVRADVATLDKHLASDYIRIRSNGSVQSKADILDWFKTGKLKMSVDDASDVTIHSYGNTAVVVTTENVKGVLMGKEYAGQYRDSRVFVKRAGEWKEVLHTSTKIMP